MTAKTLAFAGALLFATAGAALAHVTFEEPEAPAGGAYKAVLRVGHGCEGAATTAIRVRIPDGVIAAQPMPKPGWTVETTVGAYAEPAELHGETLTEGVREISWSGGDLPDGFYDEFTFRARLTPGLAGETIYFPVVQECGEAANRWIEIPAEGQDAEELEEPAPALIVTTPPTQ
jgi:periplasmic copper chaperone A